MLQYMMKTPIMVHSHVENFQIYILLRHLKLSREKQLPLFITLAIHSLNYFLSSFLFYDIYYFLRKM